MKIYVSTLTLLLAGSAIAVPSNKEQARKQDIQQKLKKLRNGGRFLPFKGERKVNNFTDTTSLSGNWGGAVIDSTGITQVESTFTVPDVSLAPKDAASSTFYGGAWVGIDGADSCSQGLWQAGAYWLYSNDAWEYFSFYEWYPGPVEQASLSIAAGDSITVKIVANSDTSGTYYFTNNANGQTASGSLSGQPALCQQTVEWIVENNNGAGVQMPDFGSVTFSDCSYLTNGASAGVSGADISIISNSGVSYTNCATSGNSVVSCSWQS